LTSKTVLVVRGGNYKRVLAQTWTYSRVIPIERSPPRYGFELRHGANAMISTVVLTEGIEFGLTIPYFIYFFPTAEA
jgi:hypothetical protein